MSTNQSSDQDQSQSAGRGGSESEYMPLQMSKIDSFGTVYGVCVCVRNSGDYPAQHYIMLMSPSNSRFLNYLRNAYNPIPVIIKWWNNGTTDNHKYGKYAALEGFFP